MKVLFIKIIIFEKKISFELKHLEGLVTEGVYNKRNEKEEKNVDGPTLFGPVCSSHGPAHLSLFLSGPLKWILF